MWNLSFALSNAPRISCERRGLAYHAAYSLVAATFWAIVMKFAWPTRLEEWADEPND